MGKAEEVQEKMKADMEAMKEQMTTMMEAMMSMRKIMEANAIVVAATSVVTKVNSMPPSGLKQMNHPTSDMVGKDLGSTDDPMMCKFKTTTPSRHMACLPTIRHPMWHTLPMRMSITPLLYPLRASNPELSCTYMPLKGKELVVYPYKTLCRALSITHNYTSCIPQQTYYSVLLWKMVGYTPSSFADLVFTDKMIEVGLKRGKSDHHALINAKKIGASEEGENEGETHVVTAIPIQPSFPPTQQCHYSANNKLSLYPPPSYPQRPSLNQPQSLSITLLMTNTTFSTNQNTNQKGILQQKACRIHPKFRCHMLNLLSNLLNNSMVAITPARFPTSNVQSFEFGMIGPLDESISCFFNRVDPWVHIVTFRGLDVLAIKGLHVLAFSGLHVLAFRGLRVLAFSGLHIRTLREFKFLRHPLILEGDQLCEHNQKGRLSRSYYTYRGKISPVPLQRDEDRARKTPSGPGEVQQGPGVSSSGYGPLSDLQGARPPQQGIAPARHPVDPEKSNRVLELPTLITDLCRFYGVPVVPSKVIRPPTNQAFIKKYCAPRQAQGETHQQLGDGRQWATDALLSPLEFTSTHPQKRLECCL
ncbi:hypothetical protein HKD37_06G017094 [Glycine soja]